jgi:putative Mn2+ efflux pump MntP
VNFIEIFLIALSMAMDAFAVCLGAGAQEETTGPRPTFRLAFHFGLFQFLMPVLGWFAGATIERYIFAYDHWIAFGLLAFVGGRMVRSGFHPEEKEEKNDPSRGWTLVLLSIAVSIDALAVGLSLGLIGVVPGMVAWLGFRLGNKLGEKFGKPMEIARGIILILIGMRILLVHLLGI